MRPRRNLGSDLPEFVAHRLAFARRIGGTGLRFESEAHRFIVLEQARRAYDPSGIGPQIAVRKERLSR